jgi:hypothetical protein
MADGALSLADSVKLAVETEDKKTGETDANAKESGDNKAGDKVEQKTESKEEKKPATDSKSVEEADPVEEVDLSQEELGNAVRLFKALANPETRAGVIKMMAEQAGYDLGKAKDAKALSRDLKTVLREKLGDSADLLQSDKIAEALDEVLEERVKKITDPVLERLSRAEQEANQNKANTAMDAMFKRHDITVGDREKVAGMMLKKMERMPATPTTDINEYLDDIYSLVSKDAAGSKKVKEVVDKIKSNANDVRASGDGGTDEKRIKSRSGVTSIREAVEAAFRGEKLEE